MRTSKQLLKHLDNLTDGYIAEMRAALAEQQAGLEQQIEECQKLQGEVGQREKDLS